MVSSFSSYTTTTTTIMPNQNLPSVAPIKPKRPLTAYHLFLQLEREYMIQTSDEEVENKSMFDGKTILEDVPQRYKNIKLPPDWYAGPGKRKKRSRKERKKGKKEKKKKRREHCFLLTLSRFF